MTSVCRPSRAEKGSALIISLIFLLLLTILGVASMQSATLQERMSGNSRDRNIAFQAAEAALRGAEDELSKAVVPNFDNSQAGFRQQVNNSGSSRYWSTTYDWAVAAGADSGSQPYGGVIGNVAAAPRFVIEELPPTPAVGESVKLGQLEESGFYRVTVRAVGGTTDTAVILQSVYKR